MRAGKAPSATLSKLAFDDAPVERSADAGEDRVYTFTISTPDVDRDRDVIALDGWDTRNFVRAGGPVLWMHDPYGGPIGKTTEVYVAGGKLKAKMQFLPGDANAERVRRYVDFGAVRATSVGFRALPGKAAWNDERSGIDFAAQELLEWSIVPVPANPRALREGKSGIRNFGAGVLAELHGFESLFARHSDLAKAIDFALAISKRGRILSEANETRIRNARGNGDELVRTLDEVLAQLEQIAEEAEDDKTTLTPLPVPTYSFAVKLRPEPLPVVLPISSADVASLTRTALKSCIDSHIRRQTGRLED